MPWHALATYERAGVCRPALATTVGLFDLAALQSAAEPQSIPFDGGVGEILADWRQQSTGLARLADWIGQRTQQQVRDLSPLEEGVPLKAPFMPQRIFGAASNFIDHAQEMGTVLAAKTDSMPYMFMKAETSVIGPHDEIVLPHWAKQVDWEVELTAVIGIGGRDIPVARALDHVAAYTVMNDVSARDLGRRTDFPFKQDWFRQKSFDTFGPMGPWLVPAALIADPQKVGLRLTVNDDIMQDGTTAEMIFTVAEQIAYLSRIVTLKAGDVVMTGTPDGVGMSRGVFLKPGDVVTASIDGIGAIRNPVTSAS